MKRIWRILGSFVLAVAFMAPVYAFIKASAAPALPPRQPPPPVTTVPVVTIPSYHSAVPVLVYHDLSNADERYTVTPQAFATQIAALHRAGFHTITAGQMLGFLHEHARLPDKPFLIAFDDGLGSEWRIADPILAKYRMHAVAFVITRQAQHGFYYLHPAEIQAMIKSGRWDMKSHADVKQYYVRHRTFRARVYHKTTATDLLRLLKARTPLPVGLAGMPDAWTVLGTRHATLTHARNGVLTLAPRVKHWLAVGWDPARTAEWSNYQASVAIGNLGAEGSGTSGSLLCGKYAVTISAGRLRITSGTQRWQSVIPETPSHKITVTTTRALQVAVDGRVVKTIDIPRSHGGISLGAWRTKAQSLYPSFNQLTVKSVRPDANR
jgi:polysaccharide deacetylase